jgi:hypothetical protein
LLSPCRLQFYQGNRDAFISKNICWCKDIYFFQYLATQSTKKLKKLMTFFEKRPFGGYLQGFANQLADATDVGLGEAGVERQGKDAGREVLCYGGMTPELAGITGRLAGEGIEVFPGMDAVLQ